MKVNVFLENRNAKRLKKELAVKQNFFLSQDCICIHRIIAERRIVGPCSVVELYFQTDRNLLTMSVYIRTVYTYVGLKALKWNYFPCLKKTFYYCTKKCKFLKYIIISDNTNVNI